MVVYLDEAVAWTLGIAQSSIALVLVTPFGEVLPSRLQAEGFDFLVSTGRQQGNMGQQGGGLNPSFPSSDIARGTDLLRQVAREALPVFRPLLLLQHQNAPKVSQGQLQQGASAAICQAAIRDDLTEIADLERLMTTAQSSCSTFIDLPEPQLSLGTWRAVSRRWFWRLGAMAAWSELMDTPSNPDLLPCVAGMGVLEHGTPDDPYLSKLFEDQKLWGLDLVSHDLRDRGYPCHRGAVNKTVQRRFDARLLDFLNALRQLVPRTNGQLAPSLREEIERKVRWMESESDFLLVP